MKGDELGRDPPVAVLIPAGNQAASIGRCLDQVRPRMSLGMFWRWWWWMVIPTMAPDRSQRRSSPRPGWPVDGPQQPGGSTPSNRTPALRSSGPPSSVGSTPRASSPRTMSGDVPSSSTRGGGRRGRRSPGGGAPFGIHPGPRDRPRAQQQVRNGPFPYRRGARSGPAETVYLGVFRPRSSSGGRMGRALRHQPGLRSEPAHGRERGRAGSSTASRSAISPGRPFPICSGSTTDSAGGRRAIGRNR